MSLPTKEAIESAMKKCGDFSLEEDGFDSISEIVKAVYSVDVAPLVERVNNLEALVSKLRNLADMPDIQEKVLRDFRYYELSAERDALKEEYSLLKSQDEAVMNWERKERERLSMELAECQEKLYEARCDPKD